MVLSNVIVDVIQLTLTLKMTTAQVVETSVTVNNNSPIQDYVHPDDQTQTTFSILHVWLMILGRKMSSKIYDQNGFRVRFYTSSKITTYPCY